MLKTVLFEEKPSESALRRQRSEVRILSGAPDPNAMSFGVTAALVLY